MEYSPVTIVLSSAPVNLFAGRYDTTKGDRFSAYPWEDEMTKAFMTVFAAAALAMTVNGAFAAVTVNNSRSNTFKAINVNDAAAVSACTKGGGAVGKDPKGHDACITPKKK